MKLFTETQRLAVDVFSLLILWPTNVYLSIKFQLPTWIIWSTIFLAVTAMPFGVWKAWTLIDRLYPTKKKEEAP